MACKGSRLKHIFKWEYLQKEKSELGERKLGKFQFEKKSGYIQASDMEVLGSIGLIGISSSMVTA